MTHQDGLAHAFRIRIALFEAVRALIRDAGIPLEFEKWMRDSPPVPRLAPRMRYEAFKALQRIRWATVIKSGVARIDPGRMALAMGALDAEAWSGLPEPASLIELSLKVFAEMARWEDMAPEAIDAHIAECLETWERQPGWKFVLWTKPSIAKGLPYQWAAIAAREELMALRAAKD